MVVPEVRAVVLLSTQELLALETKETIPQQKVLLEEELADTFRLMEALVVVAQEELVAPELALEEVMVALEKLQPLSPAL
jgi:hypothetical protein